MIKLMKLMGMLCAAVLLLAGLPQQANAMAPNFIRPGTYVFHPANGDKNAVMAVTDGRDCDVLVIDRSTNDPDMYFTIDQEGNGGFFTIRVEHTGDYLDANGIRTDKGLQVVTREYTGNKSQLWYARKQTDGTYAIYSAISTKDKHYALRYSYGKVILVDEYNVGKNWFWRLNNIAD